MPVYEYCCMQCDNQFEEFSRTMNSRVSPACPSCGSSKVERRLSVFAARQEVAAKPAAGGSPCGRCGDPDGPCSL
ncbi:MAG: zinc ribbon domain-containing protein [Planctomycetes bacterium]|nr:zinc ribbon domain-containing protein [Planctomycetota bacterium]